MKPLSTGMLERKLNINVLSIVFWFSFWSFVLTLGFYASVTILAERWWAFYIGLIGSAVVVLIMTLIMQWFQRRPYYTIEYREMKAATSVILFLLTCCLLAEVFYP